MVLDHAKVVMLVLMLLASVVYLLEHVAVQTSTWLGSGSGWRRSRILFCLDSWCLDPLLQIFNLFLLDCLLLLPVNLLDARVEDSEHGTMVREARLATIVILSFKLVANVLGSLGVASLHDTVEDTVSVAGHSLLLTSVVGVAVRVVLEGWQKRYLGLLKPLQYRTGVSVAQKLIGLCQCSDVFFPTEI